MMPIKSIYKAASILAPLSFMLLPAYAGETGIPETQNSSIGSSKNARNWFISAGGDARMLFWNPKDLNGVRFRTAGLKAYAFHLSAGFNSPRISAPAIHLSWEAPFNSHDPKQADMLAADSHRGFGIERFTCGIRPDDIAYHLFPNIPDNKIVTFLLSVEAQYSRTVFYGEATTSTPFFYLPSSATVDWGTKKVYGGRNLNAGTTLAFRTEFVERMLSFRIYRHDNLGHEVRIGYYDAVWGRPSANNDYWHLATPSGNIPLLSETRYKSSGIMAGYRPADHSSAGLKINAMARLGVKCDTAQTLPTILRSGETMSCGIYDAGIAYNWYAHPETGTGLFLSAGATGRFYVWNISTGESGTVVGAGDNGASSRVYDSDLTYSFYAGTGYRF